MALAEGEYEFECDDCRGEGTVWVDEKVAAEKILYGQKPIRTPAGT